MRHDGRSYRTTLIRLGLPAVGVFLACELLVRVAAPVLGEPLVHWTPVAQAKLEQLDAMDETSDVVFIGNSTVVEGVSIGQFEAALPCVADAYNAGLNSMTTHIARRWTLEEIIPRTDADLVIYGLAHGSFSDVDDEQADGYDAAPAVRRDGDDLRRRLGSKLALYRYRNTLRDPETMRTFAAAVRHRSLDEGQVEREVATLDEHGDLLDRTTSSLPPATLGQMERVPPLSVPDRARRDLLELAADLRESGARLVLVAMPAVSRQANLAAAAAELAEELDVPLVDASTAIADASEFADHAHLNATGAAKLGTWLGNALAAEVCSESER